MKKINIKEILENVKKNPKSVKCEDPKSRNFEALPAYEKEIKEEKTSFFEKNSVFNHVKSDKNVIIYDATFNAHFTFIDPRFKLKWVVPGHLSIQDFENFFNSMDENDVKEIKKYQEDLMEEKYSEHYPIIPKHGDIFRHCRFHNGKRGTYKVEELLMEVCTLKYQVHYKSEYELKDRLDLQYWICRDLILWSDIMKDDGNLPRFELIKE